MAVITRSRTKRNSCINDLVALHRRWIAAELEDDKVNRWNVTLFQESRNVTHNYMVYIGAYLIEEFIRYVHDLFALIRENETIINEDVFHPFRLNLCTNMGAMIMKIKQRESVRPFQQKINDIEINWHGFQLAWGIQRRDVNTPILDCLEMARL